VAELPDRDQTLGAARGTTPFLVGNSEGVADVKSDPKEKRGLERKKGTGTEQGGRPLSRRTGPCIPSYTFSA
jgi:hypothetical protein